MLINLTDQLTRELGKKCQHQIDTGFLFYLVMTQLTVLYRLHETRRQKCHGDEQFRTMTGLTPARVGWRCIFL